MQLLVINEIDVTRFINESSYIMNSTPVYEEWTDANYKTHRSEYRRRVKGSFDLCFITLEQYDDFIALLKSALNKNLLTATFYVGGDVNNYQELNVYYTLENVKTASISSKNVFNKVKMTIEEK